MPSAQDVIPNFTKLGCSRKTETRSEPGFIPQQWPQSINEMERYRRFSEVFYLVILSLTIPFYLILYGASGHEFRPEPEDVMWMQVIIAGIISMIAYLIARRFKGIGSVLIKIIFGLTLICILYGGLKVLWHMINFRFGDDIFFLIQILFYIVPIVFVYSILNMGFWLIKGRRIE